MLNSVTTGEFVGDVADPDSRVHGGEEGGFLLPGPCRQMLLEHGQLQRCHGVPGRTQVERHTQTLSQISSHTIHRDVHKIFFSFVRFVII